MRLNRRLPAYRFWRGWVLIIGMMTVASGCTSTPRSPASSGIQTEFDAEAFTLSFQGSDVPIQDLVATLKAKHGIAVTPHAESGVDRQSISDSFGNLGLMPALDRIFGANRYHFEILDGDRSSPGTSYGKTQPDEAFAKRPGLEEMPREPELRRPDGSEIAMAAPEAIKVSEELRPTEGSMPVARDIKPEPTTGNQRARDDAVPPGSHLRIRLICVEDGFAVEHVKVAEGKLTQRRTVVGDFFVALMDDDKVVHLLSRQNPLLEHPFHHERDARGNLTEGPIRIKPGESCTPFTISLPATQRMATQRIQFFEYVSKPGSFAPSRLDEESYFKSLEWLEPRGNIPGATVLRVLQEEYKSNGESQ